MSPSRRVAVWVSNDLTYDQRVKKTCETLLAHGWTPYLVGRDMPGSVAYDGPFAAERLKFSADRGWRFYASLQLGLWRWVRSRGKDFDAIWCNDLDTLVPALLWGRLPVVYDSHEYFTEAAGLTGRPLRRSIWLLLEKWAMKRLPSMITVNDSIAQAYQKRYGLTVEVVRNMPRRLPPVNAEGREAFKAFGVPTDLPLVLMQGAYMDRDRGAAEAVAALPSMPGLRLVLVGAGVEWEEARESQERPEFGGRLHCIPKLPFESLRTLTASADVGLSLDKAGHGNYEMSLPNKLFDFIHAGLPMVVTARKEVAAIVEAHGLGEVIDEPTPEAIAAAVSRVLAQEPVAWRAAMETASEAYHWGVDEPKLLRVLDTCLKAHLAQSQKG